MTKKSLSVGGQTVRKALYMFRFKSNMSPIYRAHARNGDLPLPVITQPIKGTHVSSVYGMFGGQSVNLWLNGDEKPIKITAPDEGIESYYSLAEVHKNGKFAEYVFIKEWD